VIAAQGCYQTKLVGGGLIRDERGKSSQTSRLVIQDASAGSFQSKIGAVSRQAPVVGEAFAVVAEAELVVGAVKTAVAGDQFGLAVALEAGTSNYVEDPEGAVAIFGGVAGALDLEIIDVLGIELRTDVGSDICVGNGNAVEQPCDLVSTPDVKLVVDHVGAGNIIRDHGQTVGLVGAWSLGNLFAADYARGSGGFGIDRRRSVNDLDGFFAFGDSEREVQAGIAARSKRESLLLGSESGDLDCDCVSAERHGVEVEFAGAVRGGGLSPIGSFSPEDDPATLDGTVLRIVDQAADGAEDGGARRDCEQENSE